MELFSLFPESSDRADPASLRPQRPQTAKKSAKLQHNIKVKEPKNYNWLRPPLLQELDAMLSSRLAELEESTDNTSSDTDDWLSMKRLAIYRSAFTRFIEEFNIYKPFLVSVKHEYEAALDHYSNNTRNNIAIKADLVTKEREFSQKLAQKDQDCAAKIAEYEHQKLRLDAVLQQKDKELERMRKQIDDMVQKAATVEKDTAEVKNSCLTLTNALLRLEEEKKQIMSRENAKQSDFLSLKIALQKSNNDLERLRHQLQDLEGERSAMVGQDVVDRHLIRIDELEEKLHMKEAQHKQLIQRYTSLKGVIEETFLKHKISHPTFTAGYKNADAAAVQHTMTIITNSMQSPTAHLDWNSNEIGKLVQNLLDGENVNPRILIECLLDEIIQLKKELTLGFLETVEGATDSVQHGVQEDGVEEKPFHAESKIDSPWAHFDGKGLHASIPTYLRISGKVQNLVFSKRETEIYVNEIWMAKEQYEQRLRQPNTDTSEDEEPPKIQLQEFFSIFLDQKFKTHARSAEFAYNFLDSLKKYSFDSDVKLFDLILHGELPEEIRMDQLNMLNALKEEFRREESIYHTPLEGRLSIDSFMRVLRRILPTKGEHAMRRLEKALELEIKGRKYVLYEEIMEEDEQGNQGKFCETLRMQHVNECTTFSNHVLEVVDQFHAEYVAANYPNEVEENFNKDCMKIPRFRETLVFSDPDCPRVGINKLLARGCGTSVENILMMEAKRENFNVQTFKENLKRGLLKKSPPVGEALRMKMKM